MTLAALVSFDQIQFQTPRKVSLLYWTLIGTYFVEGEQLETHTLLDANVFDLGSRALLFSGSGSSIVRDTSTLVEIDEKHRASSVLGFEKATDDLIQSLRLSLNAFREHAKRGTVRGMGTPRIQVQSEELGGRFEHSLHELPLHRHAPLSERYGLDPAIARERPPFHQSALLEAIHEPGHGGRIPMERLGQ